MIPVAWHPLARRELCLRHETPEYLITRCVVGSAEEITIDVERFKRIVGAQDGILLNIDVEERISLVLESYREFELGLFASGLRWAMHEDWRWESRRDEVFDLNRLILDLVNAILMYRDHVSGEVDCRSCISRTTRDELSTRIAAAFLSRPLLAVRLLRNYCQHRNLGFQGVGVTNARYLVRREIPKSSWKKRLFTTAVVAVKVAELSSVRLRKNDPARQVLQELRAKKETWNPTPDLRRAIDELTKAHSDVRGILSQSLCSWRGELEWVLEAAGRSFSSLVGLCVVERYKRGRYGAPIHVFPEMLGRVDELQRRNGGPTDLTDRIVTAAEPIRRE